MRNLHWIQAAIVSASVAAFFTLLVPLQTYLANRELFGFPAGAVLLEALPWFAALAVGSFLLLALSELALGRIVHVLVAATDRKFRAKFGRAWWSAGRSSYFYEWRYDDAGKVISCENLGVFKAN